MQAKNVQAGFSLLLLLVVLGLVFFLIVATFFPIKDVLLGNIYPKPPSQAANTEVNEVTNSDVFEERWDDRISIGENWQLTEAGCVNAISNNTIDCQTFRATFNKNFTYSKNIILSGGFLADPTTLVEVGLQAEGLSVAQISSQSGFIDALSVDIINPGQSATRLGGANKEAYTTFKLVYAKDDDGRSYVYYYLNNQNSPAKKVEVNYTSNLVPFISCKGKCALDNLKIVGDAS